MKIKILYEDSNILAVDKPSGILTHPAPEQARYGASPDKTKTIFDLFLKQYPKLELVHRLDKETSGVLLLAKNQKAHEFLKKQFQNREIKKIYHAIVVGKVKNKEGIVNKPIGRSPSDFRRRLAGRGARGELRESITRYKVLKYLKNFTYLEIKPKTGRTHQIRVHMKYLNHPVLGDKLYNSKVPPPQVWVPTPNLPPSKGEEKEESRMFLHAKSIEFKDLKGKIVKVESPVPKEFRKMVE